MIRLTDIILSFVGLACLSPILLPVMLILRLTGEGEIFYSQTRVGKGGVRFGVLKFATMLKDSPNMGTGTITLENDPRVFPFGKFLRKTKINELPQLINVFLGQMSLIGPRPLTDDTFGMYSQNAQDHIKLVTPGLSGVGSVFFRSEESFLGQKENSREVYANVIAPYKEKLEIWYVNNVSYILYWKLIFLTGIAVIRPNGFELHSYMPQLPEIPENLRGV